MHVQTPVQDYNDASETWESTAHQKWSKLELFPWFREPLLTTVQSNFAMVFDTSSSSPLLCGRQCLFLTVIRAFLVLYSREAAPIRFDGPVVFTIQNRSDWIRGDLAVCANDVFIDDKRLLEKTEDDCVDISSLTLDISKAGVPEKLDLDCAPFNCSRFSKKLKAHRAAVWEVRKP